MDKQVATLIDTILHDVEKLQGQMVELRREHRREIFRYIKVLSRIRKDIYDLVNREDELNGKS